MILVKPLKDVSRHYRRLIPGDFRTLAAQLDRGETLVAVVRHQHHGMCAIALPRGSLYDELFSDECVVPRGFYAVPLKIKSVTVRRKSSAAERALRYS